MKLDPITQPIPWVYNPWQYERIVIEGLGQRASIFQHPLERRER